MNHARLRYSVGVFAGAIAWGVCGAEGIAAPDATAESPAPSTWAEKKAMKLSGEALGKDYSAGHYDVAEKKIREGIQICMVQNCAAPIQARLHRDLGVVYIAGMKHVEDGKDEFTAALKQDPNVVLTPASAEIPAVKQAFDEVKNPVPEKVAQPEPAKPAPEPVKKPEEKKPEEKAKEPDKAPPPEPVAEVPAGDEQKPILRNWLSLGIQEDFVLHSAQTNVCGSSGDYRCYNGYGARQRPYNPGDYVAGGNQMSGGLQPGTLRVLAGYDRVIGRRFTAGARLGAMIQGRARITQGDSAVMQYHAEARAALWLGRDPFNALIRPYIFVSGGLAETDSKVVVQLQQTDNTKPCASSSLCAFDAWKRSGMGFVGGGAGLMAAVTRRGGPNAELRYLQYFGPSTPALALEIGYMFGF